MLFRSFAVVSVVLCLAVLPALADTADDKRADETSVVAESPVVDAPIEPSSESVATDAEPVEVESEAVVEIDSEEITEIVVKLGKDDEKPAKKASKKVWKKKPALKDYTSAQLSRASRVARDALNYRGARYVWGGDGRFGVFDCSGFTQYLYAKKGVKLPHSAKIQFKMGSRVERCDLRDGDLVFFNTRGPISHVGMYIGDGKFIHAANPRRGVVTSNLDDGYYGKRYAGARRYAN